MRIFILSLVLLLSTSALLAQNLSWRKHRKLAEELERSGNLFEAAENYRMAWEKNQSREKLIYAAAENYSQVREYRAAAEAYQHLQTEVDDYPLVNLKYARALKQDGQYDRAREAFQRVLDNYGGPDRAILEDIIRTEIRGIDLARDLASQADRRLEVSRPGSNINTEFNEFAPSPVSADEIYFTSSMGGQTRIYATTRQGRAWNKATTPAGFPVVQDGQYGSGAMSPDAQRFYFTICNAEGGWRDLNTRCEIYVTRRTGTGWSQPQRLPDYINVQGVNTTHPGIVHIAGQEFLYFSSNREGGRGGMDLWYAIRDLGLDNNEFTFPVNLGPVVNTLGDEITPFYNSDERALYFASNGHPSMGGYDVFKSLGEEINWAQPENVGLPINSGADDYGYVRDRLGFGNGFFVSNRVFGGEKINTRDSDIFEFVVGGRQMTLKANVYDQNANSLLNNINVALFQLFDNGTESMLVSKMFPAGSYFYELLPNRRFRVEVTRQGYQPGSYTFSTNDPNTFVYGQPLYLEVDGGYVPPGATPTQPYPGTTTGTNPTYPTTPTYPSTPSYPATTPTYPGGSGAVLPGGATTPTNPSTGYPPATTPQTTGTTGQSYTARATSPADNQEYISSAPRYQGTYYKIQLSAVSRFNPNSGNYPRLASLGTLETEELPGRNLYRVLLANFFNEQAARQALQEVQRNGFVGAYMVRYDNGVRYGKVN